MFLRLPGSRRAGFGGLVGMHMERIFWIFLGSGLGGVARFALNGWVTAKVGSAFPWGTLLVNVSGSWLIGVIGALVTSTGRPSGAHWAGDFLVIGILGGFTTYSAYSFQTLMLARSGHELRAMLYALGTLALCLLAVAAGAALGRILKP
jgi:CrcB protein